MPMVGEPQDDHGCSADFGIRRALVRKPGMQKLQATSTSGPCGRRASRVWVFHRAAWPAAACRAAAHGQGRGKFEIVLDSWRLIHLMTSRASDETEFEILARKNLSGRAPLSQGLAQFRNRAHPGLSNVPRLPEDWVFAVLGRLFGRAVTKVNSIPTVHMYLPRLTLRA